MHIDHFLLGKPLVKRLKYAAVDEDVQARKGANDQAPVWIELA